MSGPGRKILAAGLTASAVLMGIGSLSWGAGDEPVFRRVVLFENEEVEVLELRYEPGSETPLHTHVFPHRVLYVAAGGTLEIFPGRKAKDGTLELVPTAR